MSMIHTQTFTHKTLISATPIRFSGFRVLKPNPRLNRFFIGKLVPTSRGANVRYPRKNHNRLHCSNGSNSEIDPDTTQFVTKRNVVEHICLLKAKEEIADQEEKDMLDYLYTLQYQMGGIVAISLGCISDRNPDGYTHAVYVRFQRIEDLAKFYKNPSYLGVLEEHVMPFCHGLITVDYKCEVEDDILLIFRKGEEFNFGVEFMLLISVVKGAPVESIEDALASFAKLTMEYPSLIVQATQGSNLNASSSHYTHAAVIRFRSSDAFEMFVGSSKYRDMWVSKFEPIVEKSLALHFPIEPVGTELM